MLDGMFVGMIIPPLWDTPRQAVTTYSLIGHVLETQKPLNRTHPSDAREPDLRWKDRVRSDPPSLRRMWGFRV